MCFDSTAIFQIAHVPDPEKALLSSGMISRGLFGEHSDP
jgi:hypothetical protein